MATLSEVIKAARHGVGQNSGRTLQQCVAALRGKPYLRKWLVRGLQRMLVMGEQAAAAASARDAVLVACDSRLPLVCAIQCQLSAGVGLGELRQESIRAAFAGEIDETWLLHMQWSFLAAGCQMLATALRDSYGGPEGAISQDRNMFPLLNMALSSTVYAQTLGVVMSSSRDPVVMRALAASLARGAPAARAAACLMQLLPMCGMPAMDKVVQMGCDKVELGLRSAAIILHHVTRIRPTQAADMGARGSPGSSNSRGAADGFDLSACAHADATTGDTVRAMEMLARAYLSPFPQATAVNTSAVAAYAMAPVVAVAASGGQVQSASSALVTVRKLLASLSRQQQQPAQVGQAAVQEQITQVVETWGNVLHPSRATWVSRWGVAGAPGSPGGSSNNPKALRGGWMVARARHREVEPAPGMPELADALAKLGGEPVVCAPGCLIQWSVKEVLPHLRGQQPLPAWLQHAVGWQLLPVAAPTMKEAGTKLSLPFIMHTAHALAQHCASGSRSSTGAAAAAAACDASRAWLCADPAAWQLLLPLMRAGLSARSVCLWFDDQVTPPDRTDPVGQCTALDRATPSALLHDILLCTRLAGGHDDDAGCASGDAGDAAAADPAAAAAWARRVLRWLRPALAKEGGLIEACLAAAAANAAWDPPGSYAGEGKQVLSEACIMAVDLPAALAELACAAARHLEGHWQRQAAGAAARGSGSGRIEAGMAGLAIAVDGEEDLAGVFSTCGEVVSALRAMNPVVVHCGGSPGPGKELQPLLARLQRALAALSLHPAVAAAVAQADGEWGWEAALARMPKEVHRGCFNPGCCNTPGSSDAGVKYQWCGGCSCAQYCSPACQKAAWKAHKPVCGHLKQLREGRRKQQAKYI